MLEIIALIFLCREIGKLAKEKGLKPSTWQIYLVGGWIIAEIFGCIIGFVIFGPDNLISVALVGLVFAFSGYFGIRSFLDKYPDAMEDDINHIGE